MKSRNIEALRASNLESLADFFKSGRKKIIFGKGKQAWIVYELCKRLETTVEGFMCSSKQALINRYPILP